MAHARLHIICGNCGANDDFEHKIKQERDDELEDSEATRPVVYIGCNNCGTLHALEDYSTLKSR